MLPFSQDPRICVHNSIALTLNVLKSKGRAAAMMRHFTELGLDPQEILPGAKLEGRVAQFYQLHPEWKLHPILGMCHPNHVQWN